MKEIPFFEKQDGVYRMLTKYLGQYTHRVAITNQRIIGIDAEGVSFMQKDDSDKAK